MIGVIVTVSGQFKLNNAVHLSHSLLVSLQGWIAAVLHEYRNWKEGVEGDPQCNEGSRELCCQCYPEH